MVMTTLDPVPKPDEAMVDRWLADTMGMPAELLVANALAVAAAAIVAAAPTPRDAYEQAVEIGRYFPEMVNEMVNQHLTQRDTGAAGSA